MDCSFWLERAKDAYRILLGKHPHGRPRRRCDDGTEIDLREVDRNSSGSYAMEDFRISKQICRFYYHSVSTLENRQNDK